MPNFSPPASGWTGIIGQLSPAGQAVFNLYVIDGYSHEEIAEQLHMSVGASKTNLYFLRLQHLGAFQLRKQL